MKKNLRRSLKLLGMTMLLALCLLLTGCVVPPEDIGTNGGYVVTDNDLPFQSLGPKITPTPYTAPTNSPTPTPSPTPNGNKLSPSPPTGRRRWMRSAPT